MSTTLPTPLTRDLDDRIAALRDGLLAGPDGDIARGKIHLLEHEVFRRWLEIIWTIKDENIPLPDQVPQLLKVKAQIHGLKFYPAEPNLPEGTITADVWLAKNRNGWPSDQDLRTRMRQRAQVILDDIHVTLDDADTRTLQMKATKNEWNRFVGAVVRLEKQRGMLQEERGRIYTEALMKTIKRENEVSEKIIKSLEAVHAVATEPYLQSSTARHGNRPKWWKKLLPFGHK